MPRKPTNFSANDPFLRLSDVDTDSESTDPAEQSSAPSDTFIAAQIHQTSSTDKQNENIRRIYERMEREAQQLLKIIQSAKTDQSWNWTPGLIPKTVSAQMIHRLTKIENELFSYESQSVWISVLGKRSPHRKQTVSKEHIHISVHPDSINIYLPYLPKRYNGNLDMLHHMLHEEISATPNFPKWPVWKAAFTLVYPNATRSFSRDVDNYHYKKIIDTIAESLWTTDDAHHFSFDKITSVFTDDTPPGAYIEITPKSFENPDFGKWEL